MIDVEPPSTLTGIALLVLAIFLIGTLLMTGIGWALIMAAVVGVPAAYFGVKLLKGLDRRVTHVFTGGRRK